MLFTVNDYIFLLQLTLVSHFSTYKYHLGAWRKTQQQIIKFSQKCYSFVIYTLLKQ